MISEFYQPSLEMPRQKGYCVDTQFPNIFREKNIKQPFTMFHIKTNIEAKASQLINTLLEKLNAVGRRE